MFYCSRIIILDINVILFDDEKKKKKNSKTIRKMKKKFNSWVFKKTRVGKN